MKTSYYAVVPDSTPGAIAISRSLPKNSCYPSYDYLAPGSWYNSVSEGLYRRMYGQLLDKLTPEKVWADLHRLAADKWGAGTEPILLCYEKPGQFCHRRLVAEWFRHCLGYVVDELEVVPKVVRKFVDPCDRIYEQFEFLLADGCPISMLSEWLWELNGDRQKVESMVRCDRPKVWNAIEQHRQPILW